MESFELGNFLIENNEFIIDSMMESYEIINFDDIDPMVESCSWIIMEGSIYDKIKEVWGNIVAFMRKMIANIQKAFKKYTGKVTYVRRKAVLSGGLKLVMSDDFFSDMKEACNRVYSQSGFEVIDKSEFKDLPNYCKKAKGVTDEEMTRINKTLFIITNDDYFIKAPFTLNNKRFYFTNMEGMITAADVIKESGLDGMIPYMKSAQVPQYVPVHIDRMLDYDKLADKLKSGVFESMVAAMYDPTRQEAMSVCNGFSDLSAWTMDLYLGLYYITLELFPVAEKYMVPKKEA